MSVREILEQIPKLSDEERGLVLRKLVAAYDAGNRWSVISGRMSDFVGRHRNSSQQKETKVAKNSLFFAVGASLSSLSSVSF
jgi:hypothetical protein